MEFSDLGGLHESISTELMEAIRNTIESSSFIGGEQVEAFEQSFADLVGARHCVSCGSGTDALFVALKALGVEVGDEVITTAHSWIATSETITQAGASVVFVDTEQDFFTINSELIESAITDATKGIIPVHLYGQPAAMNHIKEIADYHGLWVLEDCAQAHLSTYRGEMVGKFGDVATYSFYPGKNLGAMGDAGAIVTDRDDIAEYCRLFARHGGKNQHLIEGINSRMDAIQAAVLSVKLKYLEQWTKARESVAARYHRFLPQSVEAPKVRVDCRHVYHQYTIRSSSRDRLRSFLAEHDIPTAVNYPKALPAYPAYEKKGFRSANYPNAVLDSERILSLPIHPLLADSEIIKLFSSTVISFKPLSKVFILSVFKFNIRQR